MQSFGAQKKSSGTNLDSFTNVHMFIETFEIMIIKSTKFALKSLKKNSN